MRYGRGKIQAAAGPSGNDLSPDQHIELRDHLDRIEGDRATDIALGSVAERSHRPGIVRIAGAGGAVKHGFDKHGRQRFKCREKSSGGCDRTFNLLTGTPLARMRKPERWHAFSKALTDGFIWTSSPIAAPLKRVMKAFDWQLRKKGYIPPPGDCRQSPAGQRMAGQIVDASLVPAPKQRNTEDEKQAIKEGKTAREIWPDEPNKAAQKDTNAPSRGLQANHCRAVAGP